MHLIDTATLQLHTVTSEEDEEYAILSHRWEDGEVLYEDIQDLSSCNKNGVAKLKALCKEVQRCSYPDKFLDYEFKYVWVDTCCIDKKSSAELSEAINSMYRFYSTAAVCIVYLCDVYVSLEDPDFTRQFRQSKWFTRCWTLQELIAPANMIFYNFTWERLSTKEQLRSLIADITQIDVEALSGSSVDKFSVAQRMAWASQREATRREDIAYSLMGLFNVNMPMLYGEGTKAFERLQEEIIRQSDDETIFAWSSENMYAPKALSGGLLAPSPAYFRDCQYMKCCALYRKTGSFNLTNQGIAGSFPTVESVAELDDDLCDTRLALLNASSRDCVGTEYLVGIYLERCDSNQYDTNEYIRTSVFGSDRWGMPSSRVMELREPFTANVRHKGAKVVFEPDVLHGFNLQSFNRGTKKDMFFRIFGITGIQGTFDTKLWPHVHASPDESLNDSNIVPKFIIGDNPSVVGPFFSIVLKESNGNRFLFNIGLDEHRKPVCIIVDESGLTSDKFGRQLFELATVDDYKKIPWTEKVRMKRRSKVQPHGHKIAERNGFLALRLRHNQTVLHYFPFGNFKPEKQEMWQKRTTDREARTTTSLSQISIEKLEDDNRHCLYRLAIGISQE